MVTPNISDTEFKLCLIVWEKEPVSSSTLATMCADSFGWARTTTHTFIRRLVDRGVLKNDKGIVTAVLVEITLGKTIHDTSGATEETSQTETM